MNRFEKLWRADATRKTRLHTANGKLCLQLPDMMFAAATTLARHLNGTLVPIPWICLPAFRYLRGLAEGALVFEYSTGMSTLWFAKHARQVHGVEDNPEWFEMVSGRLADAGNVSLELAREKRDYVSAIERCPESSFDIISIDGSYRGECLERAIDYLRPGGLLMVDNTDTAHAQSAVEALHRHFEDDQIRVFSGFPPGNFHPTETTICQRAEAGNGR